MGLAVSILREGIILGGLRYKIGEVTFDSSLASGGESVDLNQMGFGSLYLVVDGGGNATGAGYRFQFIPSTNKLTAFRSAGFTPAGTVAAPTFTGSALGTHAHDVLVKGGQAASTSNDIAHYATDILGKEAATDATIAGSASATKGGVIALSAGTPAGTNSAPAFSGAAQAAAAMVEATSANLATVVQRFLFIGT